MSGIRKYQVYPTVSVPESQDKVKKNFLWFRVRVISGRRENGVKGTRMGSTPSRGWVPGERYRRGRSFETYFL